MLSEHEPDNLRKTVFYEWEGMHKDEIKVKYPESYSDWQAGDPHGLAFHIKIIHDNGEV